MLVLFTLLSEGFYLLLVFLQNQSGLLNLHNDSTARLITLGLLFIFVTYFLTYFLTNWQKVSTQNIFLAVFLFHVTFLFTNFLTSDDLYSYISAGRIFAYWHNNPYLFTYDSVPADQFYDVIKTIWSSQTTLYGPLFLLISGAINILGRDNLNLTILLFKSILLAANLVNVYLIYRISQSTKSAFLYGLNPLVIFELAGNGHTESIFILFLLFSIFSIKRQETISLISLTASILVKYSTLVILPLYLIHILKNSYKTLLISLTICVCLVVFLYHPFWEGTKIFSYLRLYYGGQYISPSPGILLGKALLGYSLSFKINTLLFVLFSGFLFIRYWVKKQDLKRFIFYSLLIYFAYILLKLSLVLTWYLTPLVALASLSTSFEKYRSYSVAILGLTAIYSLLLYYFVR